SPISLPSASLSPTAGFTQLPLDHKDIEIQRPYDVPESARYSFVNGVHKMWVYSSDKTHSKNSRTNPRTELAIKGYDYSSGVWQFEAQGFVPRDTSGVCVMQIFGASRLRATTLMIRAYKGSLSYYRSPVLAPNIWNRWFKLNVIHDVDASTVKIYIDGIFVHEAAGHGGASHAFKCGVYSQNDASHYMESRWKGIKVFKKK
ncbi:citrate-binding protein-like, partial [Arachis stenosperma]|uniref:citrate-binding protein-like n=1 Tax=Arachis stenosperma TaxID=217475 RepID=UPI0025ACE529